MPMLITLGPGLYRDPVLMFKVVRITREALIKVFVLQSNLICAKNITLLCKSSFLDFINVYI